MSPMDDMATATAEALSQEHSEAIASISDLEAEFQAGLLESQEYEELRAAAMARAASAASALDRLETKPASGPARGPKGGSRRKWLLVAGVLAVVAASGVALGAYARPLLAGQTITGSEQVSSQQRLAQQLVQGRILVSQGKDVLALQLFEKILHRYPNQPEALAYEGWILASAGMAKGNGSLVARGRSYVSQAIKVAPTYPDAHLFLAEILYYSIHDTKDAKIQLRLFLDDRPSAALAARARPLAKALGSGRG